MRRSLLLFLASTWTGTGHAGFADDGGFALHRKPFNTKVTSICTSYSPNADGLHCWYYTTEAPVFEYSLIYLVVGIAPSAGVSAASFGIDYEGRAGERNGVAPEFNVFFPCFDGSAMYFDGGFGDFPSPKGAAVVTWETCAGQVIWGDVHAIIGALLCYAYSDDLLRITPDSLRSGQAELVAVDCNGQETDLVQAVPPYFLQDHMGRVGFGGRAGEGFPGCLPPDPARAVTWGRVKALYRSR